MIRSADWLGRWLGRHDGYSFGTMKWLMEGYAVAGAGVVAFSRSRASTSAAVGAGAPAVAGGFEPARGGVRIEPGRQPFVGGCGGGLLGLPFAQPLERRSASASAAIPALPGGAAARLEAPDRFRRRARCAGRVRARPGDDRHWRPRILSCATSAAKARRDLRDGVAVRFHQRDRFGRLGREIVAAVGQRRGRALLQVGDALERRLEALAFRLVLRDRDRQRALGAVRSRRRHRGSAGRG